MGCLSGPGAPVRADDLDCLESRGNRHLRAFRSRSIAGEIARQQYLKSGKLAFFGLRPRAVAHVSDTRSPHSFGS
jgi:hypothetical protein